VRTAHSAAPRYPALVTRLPGILSALVSASILLLGPPEPLAVGAPAGVLEPAPGAIIAPVGRQAAWLSLDAPRPRLLTRYLAPSYVSDVAVSSTGIGIIAVQSPEPGQGIIGGDLLRLDPDAEVTLPFLLRADATESFRAPAWQPDGSGLVYQREDISSPPLSYLGQMQVRYPARVETVRADGADRSVVVDDAMQPALSPDGGLLAYLRSSREGTALLIRHLNAGPTEEQELVPAGRFPDIASPRFSPNRDQIVFVVAVPLLSRGNLFGMLFGPSIAYAHGLPWDVWLVGSDGSGLRQLAALGADDPSVTWSPDGNQLFVYGGTGSFIVDATTGDVEAFPYLAGYGGAAWTNAWHG
jgi:hypothetical protein